MSLLANKVVCITGASRGIGRACAVECAKNGATGFILHYYGDEATTKEIESLKEEIETKYAPAKVVAVPGDIAQRETSKKVHDRTSYGRNQHSQIPSRSWMRVSKCSTG